MSLLQVQHLNVEFKTLDGLVNAVNDLSFTLDAGETLAIVGESGSGKSQTVLSIMGLLASNGQATGKILFEGQDLLSLSQTALNQIRGKKIAMIFQDPMTSLNPYLRISTQMVEVLTQHEGLPKTAAKQRCIEMLDLVKIPDAKNRIDRYPHEFSGGMRQRVAIAMALLCRPQIIIADEPTTALDVTVQAQILKLLADIQREFNTATIFITHDLGVVATQSNRVLVMYAGETMEWGSLDDIFYRPRNPYTLGLLNSIPRPNQPQRQALYSIPGNPPNMLQLPQGCPFYERCEYRLEKCATDRPTLVAVEDDHWKACHHDDLSVVTQHDSLSAGDTND